MVIPLGGGFGGGRPPGPGGFPGFPGAFPPMLTGPLTPEMQDKLRKIRYVTIGLFATSVGRMCTGDLPINELLCAFMGVLCLKEDPNMAPCYACVASTMLGSCGDGLGCVSPFMCLAGINAFLTALRLFSGGPFLILGFFCQVAACVYGYQLHLLVSAASSEGDGLFTGWGGQMPLSQPLAQMRMNPPGGGGGDGPFGGGGGGPPAQGPRPPGFSAFQGTGQRLGG
eukprot:TRINITY_DN43492_c0_g1_i1.p1 TRINITY_DN43492_c0_g1~~TRINITY_DN43492_c0_g1_i1.p1  ORF type:complete len:248 (+),score=21.16 TRINITY_DN43492_c0_g1_i1:69-746(+)